MECAKTVWIPRLIPLTFVTFLSKVVPDNAQDVSVAHTPFGMIFSEPPLSRYPK